MCYACGRRYAVSEKAASTWGPTRTFPDFPNDAVVGGHKAQFGCRGNGERYTASETANDT